MGDPVSIEVPILAQYLGTHGYATAGFVGNTVYCSYDSGLNSGFTHYEDFILEKLGPLQTATLIDKVLRTLISLDVTNIGMVHSLRLSIQQWFYTGFRRDAHAINRTFSTGLPDVKRRSVPSSRLSTTMTPMRRTSCRRERRTASLGCPKPGTRSGSSTISGTRSTRRRCQALQGHGPGLLTTTASRVWTSSWECCSTICNVAGSSIGRWW